MFFLTTSIYVRTYVPSLVIVMTGVELSLGKPRDIAECASHGTNTCCIGNQHVGLFWIFALSDVTDVLLYILPAQNVMADKSRIIESLGCHLSWPELQPYVADKETLRREEGILAKEAWDFNDRPTYYTAVRNMQGFIAYHLDKYEDALGFFLDVLDKDENNINALGNLAFIHKQLFEMEDYRKYHDRLTQILTKTCTGERAMAYADKAHAIRYLEHKLNFQYMRFIKKAVVIGRNCDSSKRAEWLFDYALALYKRDYQMLYLRELASQTSFVPEHSDWYSDDRILQGFKEACRVFLEVARTTTSRDYEALSWLFLGILVNHDSEHRSIAEAFPDNLDLHDLTAVRCFEKCLKMHPEHIMITRRVGYEYVKIGRFEQGRLLLEKSLRKSQSHVVYRYRAYMFLAMYEKADTDVKQTEEARGWLQEATASFNFALKLRTYSADYAGLGYAFFLLGSINKAIQKYSQAIRGEHDHFFDPVQTHQRWAECLELTDQSEGSRLQLEKAEQVRREILNTALVDGHSDYFNDDFDHYSTEVKPDYVRILLAHHFVTISGSPHPSEQMHRGIQKYHYDFFVWYAERDSQWAEAFVDKLESAEYGLRGCTQSRDSKGGVDVFDQFLHCLRNSHRFVIILTPHPHPLDGADPESDGWESYAISQGLMEDIANRGGHGEYIVPIKLKDCPLPVKLQAVQTVIKCKEGQFSRGDFDVLVRELIQNA
ncbi:uncharacterized protein LOC110982567 isoform X2 [Acanthaster planci]|uniref:Uncharacterized protein LOC110982567 isoform X2 n=1 Tax=Acanthaster planci TaxID=133434 RepID=A0A8B7YTY1_ACAPL|nr:uncharacterized protein LOC110982567 isoform X2 [Acanthaster planci]